MRAHPRTSGLVIGAAALSLVLAACGSSNKSGGGGSGPTGAVTIDASEPQNPLIPADTNETGGGNVVDALNTGLVSYDPKTAAPKNAMAESITTPDNVHFTIKIKKGWKFHDGTQIKAKNFVDAWNWGAYGPNAALSSYFFEPIVGFTQVQGEDKNKDKKITPDEAPVKTMSGLKVVDDQTFTVQTTSPVSNLPVRLGYSAFVPLPDSFYANPKAYGEKPVGNGPFKFVSWTHNKEIRLTANTDYQGADKPVVKNVTFKIYENQDSAYNDLLAGNLDVIATLPTTALAGDKYKSDLGKRWVDQVQGVFQSISFPSPRADKRFENKDLRHALSMAIDRDLITKTIFNNTRIPATGWVSPVVDGFKADACGEFCTYDPAKAKAALAKAGGFQGTITLSYNADGDHKAWTTAVCNSITKTLSLKCVARPVTNFNIFRGEITDRKMTGLFRTGWQMDYPSIENFLGPLYGTGAGSNDSDYSSPAFDRKLNEAAAAKTPQDANKLYQDAEQILADGMPVIPLWFSKLQAGWSTHITSIQFTPFGTAALETIKRK
jgi:oligopeptide transport system substrate-binding protein